MTTEERTAAALSGPYAGDVAEYLSAQGGDPALDLRELLEWARKPGDAPDLSGRAGDFYRDLVRAAAGLARVKLSAEVPASEVTGKPLTARQEAGLAAVASFGITMSAAGSYESLRRRGLAEKIPGRRPDSPEASWRLTAAGLAEAARALVIAASVCGARAEP